MSADNRICIMQNEAGEWGVWMGSLSTVYFDVPSHAFQFDSKEEALKHATKEAEECAVLEGGIEEITAREQSEGLAEEIQSLSRRLSNLSKYGSQWEQGNR